MDEWLHLSISCPLCKRSTREGLAQHRRGWRRPREGATVAIATAGTVPVAQPREDRDLDNNGRPLERTSSGGRRLGWWFRGWLIRPSFSRLLNRSGGGGGNDNGDVRRGISAAAPRQRRRWAPVGDSDDETERALEDDHEDTELSGRRDDDEEGIPDGAVSHAAAQQQQQRYRGSPRSNEMRVVTSELAAFFGDTSATVEQSGSDGGNREAGGRGRGRGRGSDENSLVRTAWEAFFGRGGTDGNRWGRSRLRRVGGRGGAGGDGDEVEYELAPVPDAAVAVAPRDSASNVDVV